jgi:putative oxidoreductase
VDEGLLLLRLVVGLTMAAHGAQKLFGWFGGGGIEGSAGFFASLGYRSPAVFVVLAGIAEVGGGLGLASGLLTPVAAAAVVVVLLNAIEAVKVRNGFWNGSGGFELELLLIAAAVSLAATGPGRYSLDRAVGWDDDLSGYAWGGAALAAAILVAFFTMTWGRGEPESTELNA